MNKTDRLQHLFFIISISPPSLLYFGGQSDTFYNPLCSHSVLVIYSRKYFCHPVKLNYKVGSKLNWELEACVSFDGPRISIRGGSLLFVHSPAATATRDGKYATLNSRHPFYYRCYLNFMVRYLYSLSLSPSLIHSVTPCLSFTLLNQYRIYSSAS